MLTMLVTGGCGFIGSHYIKQVLSANRDIMIINVDALTYAGNINNLVDMPDMSNYVFIKEDICNGDAISDIFKRYNVRQIVHFAAETHVDRSISSSPVFVRTNVIGTHILLECARSYWEKDSLYPEDVKFVHISTDEVYGALGEEGYFTEQTPINPHSPYSASKAASDLFVTAYHDTYGMPVCITRCSNNYGPNQYPEKLIPLIVSNALKGKKLPIYGDGENVRDWLYVEDHCNAIELVRRVGQAGEIYNVGGNNEIANIQLVKDILQIMAELLPERVDINESLIEYVPDRKGHDRRYAIDPAKIKEELAWSPSVDFEHGLKNTIMWYVKEYSYEA